MFTRASHDLPSVLEAAQIASVKKMSPQDCRQLDHPYPETVNLQDKNQECGTLHDDKAHGECAEETYTENSPEITEKTDISKPVVKAPGEHKDVQKKQSTKERATSKSCCRPASSTGSY